MSTNDEIAASCHQLGLAPTAAQLTALGDFLALLQHWNATCNLPAMRAPHAMAARIADGIDNTSAQGLITTSSVIAR